MPQGALFYIFSSRDALITEVITHITEQERLTAVLSADMVAEDASLHEVLSEAMLGYLRMLEEDPARELALLEVATHAIRHDRAAVNKQWQTYRSAVADALSYLADRMSITWELPLTQVAHLVTSAIDGLTLSWLTDRDTEAARRNIDVLATAIVTLAALVNALKVVGKKIGDVRIVVSGVGAAGTAIIKLLLAEGATVPFIARYRKPGARTPSALHERSRFTRRAGRWLYLDAVG